MTARWAFRLALGSLTAVVLLFASDSAFALSTDVDADANANVALNGQLKIDLEGLDGVVTQIDTNLDKLLATAQNQARDDIANLAQQTKTAINDQLAEIRSASVSAINLVAQHLDAQLKTLLVQAKALVTQLVNAINNTIEAVQKNILVQIQQVHSNLLDTLKTLKSDIDEQLDRAYVRTENAATTVAFQSRAFVDNAVLVAVRGILSAVLLVLLMRVVRQTTGALRSRDRFPLEPIVGAVTLCGVLALLISKPLLSGALGIPTASAPPDPCATAVADYHKFLTDKTVVAPPSARFEGITVQEELQRCAYLSVSSDRAQGAAELMTGVRAALTQLPDAVAVLAKK